MNIGLFFNKSLSIGNIFFDGHTIENPEYTATMTQNPVEYGANTTDNVVINPITLSVRALIAENPAISLTPSGIFNTFNRTADAMTVLYNLMVRRNPVGVVCNLGFFPNMIITRIAPQSDENHVTLIGVNIDLQEIYFTGEVINEDPTNNKYNSPTNKGALQPKSTPQ